MQRAWDLETWLLCLELLQGLDQLSLAVISSGEETEDLGSSSAVSCLSWRKPQNPSGPQSPQYRLRELL